MTGLTRRDLLVGAATATGALAIGPGCRGTGHVQWHAPRTRPQCRPSGVRPPRSDSQASAARSRVSRSSALRSSPPKSSAGVRQEPATFDVFSCFNQDMAEFWATGTSNPSRSPGCSAGRRSRRSTRSGRPCPAAPACTYGQGDAAFRRLYADPDRSGRWLSAPGVPPAVTKLFVQWVDESTGKSVGPEPKFSTGSPGTFNFDSFGYNAKVLGKRPDQMSWSELLQPALATTRRSQRLRPAGQPAGHGKRRPGGGSDEVR